MTQEEKLLLLKDISARLPYGVKYRFTDKNSPDFELSDLSSIMKYWIEEGKVLPYLRQMSSMTEEERMKIASMANFQNLTKSSEIVKCCYPIICYCYSRHLDINELIDKGIALEAPEGMYNNINMTQEEKDLCKTCEHYWQDFPMPLECVISHCEILDEKSINETAMDDIVPYPCVRCPFDSYKKK